MTTRYDAYRFRDLITDGNADTFNAIWHDIDRRIDPLESAKIDWEEAVLQLQGQGLLRIDESISPLLAQIQADAESIIAQLESLEGVATGDQGALADSALQPEDLGVTVQGYNNNLAALAGLTGAANRLAYFTGAGLMALTTFSAIARNLLACGDNSSMRDVLGLKIGVDVQAYSASLTSWAAKSVPGGTVVGTSDVQTLSGKTITGIRETKTSPIISSGTLTLDCSASTVFAVALNADITTLAFTNLPSSDEAFGLTLAFTADGTQRTIDWGSSVKWPEGADPVMTSTSGMVDLVVLLTFDMGSTWYASLSGQNYQ